MLGDNRKVDAGVEADFPEQFEFTAERASSPMVRCVSFYNSISFEITLSAPC